MSQKKDDEDEESPDFSKDETILKFVVPNRWVSVDINHVPFLRFNWVVTLLASIVLWVFVAVALDAPEKSQEKFGEAQSWVTQNFTWFYIGSQDMWAIFLIWLCFSKYGTIKLGKSHDKPAFDDLTWFAMLFSCGLGVGLYYWSVSEPIYYYTGYPNLMKPGFTNNDQKAQQAIFLTYFHWGLHGWVVYVVVAVCLGLSCYRQGKPLAIRHCFTAVLGEKGVNSILGDIIDALSIACTTFGVCTSLGMGAEGLAYGIDRLEFNDGNGDDDYGVDPENRDHLCWIIVVITCLSSMSVLSGLDTGIKYLSMAAFWLGNFLLIFLMFADNTGFLLNTVVQSIGYYMQYIVQIGFDCDAFQQLDFEIDPKRENYAWNGKSGGDILDRIADADITMNQDDPAGFYDQSQPSFMDWWTIFYWGWWISWAPFVGMFIARISRGRTVRNVIIGSFLAPCFFSFLWFGVFGGLGIKMQRIAELTLSTGGVNPSCADMGYEGSTPVTTQAMDLADLGYYPLSCRNHGGRIYDIVEPYTDYSYFLTLVILIGLLLYFVTSSDSGSYVDDILSAGGHENAPPIQKIYWAWTEGITAIALLKAGGDTGLKALQSVSIIAGLPYTFAMCYMVTCVYREAKRAFGDEDILLAEEWKSQVTDVFSGYEDSLAFPASKRIGHAIVGSLCPFFQLVRVFESKLMHYSRMKAQLMAGGMTVAYYLWFFMVVIGYGVRNNEDNSPMGRFNGSNCAALGWTFYMIFVMAMAMVRSEVRTNQKIYGGILEDFFTTFLGFPLVLDQLVIEESWISGQVQLKNGDPSGPVAAKQEFIPYTQDSIKDPVFNLQYSSPAAASSVKAPAPKANTPEPALQKKTTTPEPALQKKATIKLPGTATYSAVPTVPETELVEFSGESSAAL